MGPKPLAGRASDALLPIYDTMTDQSRWTPTLDLVSAAIGAVGGGLYARRLDQRPYDFMTLSALYTPETLAEYKARRFDELETEQWAYLCRQPVLRPVWDDETGIARAVLEARADYRFNRERWGIGRRLGVRLNAIAAWQDVAVFVFSARLAEVPPAALRSLAPLLPHMAKAVEAGRAFTLLRARYRAALAALDHVLVGLAVALPGGELITHNAEAARIFSLADGLTLGRDGRLRCRDDGQRLALDRAIDRAAATLRGDADVPESLEVVARPSGRHPFLIEVSPLADLGGEIESDLRGALVTLIDPDNVVPTSITRFARLHGLSRAEAEVCALLVAGSTRDEIAERRNTTPETTKRQIEAIMRKSDARRRGELIRLIFRTTPPVR